MAREETLRRVDLARRGAELWDVLLTEIPTTGLTPDEPRDLVEARDPLCAAGEGPAAAYEPWYAVPC